LAWKSKSKLRIEDIARLAASRTRLAACAVHQTLAPHLARAAATPLGQKAMPYLLTFWSCLRVGFANLTQHRPRLVAALGGVAVALFLLLLQIAVLNAASVKVTSLFDDFDFDMVIVPDTYQFLLSFDTLDRVTLNEAAATRGVADTFGLNAVPVQMTQLPSQRVAYLFLIGLDDPGRFLRDDAIRDGMQNLNSSHDLLIDTQSLSDIGPTDIGARMQINGENLAVTGQFKLGLFFYGEGSGIVRNTDFTRLAGRPPRSITMGLLKLQPGADPEDVRARLQKTLPPDTLVLTRKELITQERAYFLSTKPVGVMMYISMLVAYLVGSVILVQVLSTDISNRMGEYAVLKAMGFGMPFVYGVGAAQAALLSLGGLIPALALGAIVLWIIEYQTHLPTGLGLGLIGAMLAIALLLAAGAAAIALRRLSKADPAELF
jgi:putative ABC transport system permease protein